MLEVTLTPHDLREDVCVSRSDMSAGSQVDSGREVSWNGFMWIISCLDAEPAATLAILNDHHFSNFNETNTTLVINMSKTHPNRGGVLSNFKMNGENVIN